MIKNLIPASGGRYKRHELNEISFRCFDELSDINFKDIILKIDNKNYFYDYIKYRDLVRVNLENYLSIGKHTLEIYVEDNLGNFATKEYDFIIE